MTGRQVRAKDLVGVLRAELSVRDLAIIRQVADLSLMTGRQITDLHFGQNEHETAAAATRACNRVLVRLVRYGLLARLERRVGGVRNGSSRFVYALAALGHRVLALDGPRPRLREPGPTFALHTLAVAQLVVDCTLAARDKRFDLLNCQPEPYCWRQFTGMNGNVVVRPDLFLAVGVGEYEHRFFVEVDRGTEHLPALIRKCRIYESYYRSGLEQAAHGVSPRTCWVVPDEARVLRLRQEIDRDPHLTNQLFVVTASSRALAVLAGGGS
jgi:hypothetical protein